MPIGEKMDSSRDNLNWSKVGILIAAIVAIAAAVAAHFDGVSSAKSYTDMRVDKLELKIDKTFDKISEMQADIAAIRVKVDDK